MVVSRAPQEYRRWSMLDVTLLPGYEYGDTLALGFISCLTVRTSDWRVAPTSFLQILGLFAFVHCSQSSMNGS